MDLPSFFGNGAVVALIGGVFGSFTGWGLQRRSTAKQTHRLHRAAVAAAREELSAVEHVVRLMLENRSVMMLPVSDVAYRAMSRDLLTGLSDELTKVVVRAYAHMPLLVEAVEGATERSRQVQSQTSAKGVLLDKDARHIGLLAEDLSAAVAGLTAHAALKK